MAPWALLLLRPVFRYSEQQRAWVLRGGGNELGLSLRPDRRRRQIPLIYEYDHRRSG